jgi:hypothetical protein
MKQKTFFTYVTIVLILMAGYFSIQLISSAEKSCLPAWNFDCDVYAQLACMGEYLGAILFHSWCEGTTCVGKWNVYCDHGPDIDIEEIECTDVGNPYCESN